MSRSISATLRYAMMQQETAEVPLVLLTITHPSLVDPILLVNDASTEGGSTNVIHNGLTYVAYPFDIELPSDIEGEAPKARLSVANVDRQIAQFARSANPAPQVAIEVIRAGAPNEVGASFGPLKFGTPLIDLHNVSTDLVDDDIGLMAVSATRFDAAHFPGLVRAAS